MPKVRQAKQLYIEYDDGSRATVTYNPDADLNDILDQPLPSDPVYERQEGSKAAVTSIPGWATWTEAEVLTWITNNLDAELSGTSPKTLTAITAMARMIVALRNKNFPTLEGS